MNPLLTDDQFMLTLGNPNPTSSKTKDGPVYRISFELNHEEWQDFMDCETKGMVIEAACRVTHRNAPTRDPHTVDAFNGKADKETIKGGPLSQRSEALVRDSEFWLFLQETYPRERIETDDDVRKIIRFLCNVKSRKELDHDKYAAEAFGRLISNYMRWAEP